MRGCGTSRNILRGVAHSPIQTFHHTMRGCGKSYHTMRVWQILAYNEGVLKYNKGVWHISPYNEGVWHIQPYNEGLWHIPPYNVRGCGKYYHTMKGCGTFHHTMRECCTSPGFPKLVSLKARSGKTIFGPIKPTNPSVWMSCKGNTGHLAFSRLVRQPKSTNFSTLILSLLLLLGLTVL